VSFRPGKRDGESRKEAACCACLVWVSRTAQRRGGHAILAGRPRRR
jgi:hypothetical protein